MSTTSEKDQPNHQSIVNLSIKEFMRFGYLEFEKRFLKVHKQPRVEVVRSLNGIGSERRSCVGVVVSSLYDLEKLRNDP